MVKAKRDCINAVLILAFCGVAYYETLAIPSPVMRKTGAAFFPEIVLPVLALLGLCLLINSIIRMKKEPNEKLNFSFQKLFVDNKKVLSTFIIFGIYVLALSYIGYFISTILFLLSMYLLLVKKKEKVWMVSLGYIILTLIVYFVFKKILLVFLPTGIL
ncbi:MAG TPA: tripartite tricarboxylate transporter TctB family protein [Bacillales bacterium]